MPYSGPDDPNLPANVKKLSTKKKKKWIATFESVLHTEGKTESDAFAIANGTIKEKELVPGIWDVDERQLMPDQVNYKPLGMTSERGCGGCNWYVPPASCILVYADIMPTGVCDLFLAPPEYTPQPIPVTIVKETPPFMARMVQAIKDWVKGESRGQEVSTKFPIEESAAPPETPEAPAPGQAPVPANDTLKFYKDGDRIRFFVVYSNCFKDKQGEIITSAAHKDYVQWATENNKYPDLWLWHSGPSSKWGQADFVDFVDGFAIASGLVDKDKEFIAEALNKQKLGVSHGFKGLINGGSILRYRTFEISPLPAENSANAWTAFSSEEMTMPFSDKKKEWLKGVAGLTDEAIVEWESNLSKLGEQLKGMGLDWKDVEPDDVTGQFATLTKAMTDVSIVVGTLSESVKKLSQDMDTQISNVFKAEVAKLPQGFKASESKENIVDDKSKQKDMAWFGEIIAKGVK